MSTVLVTGATGFVGRAVCQAMLDRGWGVHAAVRSVEGATRVPAGCRIVVVGDIDGPVHWPDALCDIDVVLHLAARVHVMRERSPDADVAFQRVNVDATRHLAESAIAAGVRRLVYVSSVKAVADGSVAPIDERAPAAPTDAYGRSKRDAEQMLARLAGIEVTIVRPPLVYGPGVGGNFRRLMTLLRLAARVPLPLAGGRPRSFVFVENLASAIAEVVQHDAAAGRTFFVRDGVDLTVGDMLRHLGDAVGLRPRLFALPTSMLRAFARVVGYDAEVDRLLGGLQVDDSLIRTTLGWQPPFAVDEALALTARALARRDHTES